MGWTDWRRILEDVTWQGIVEVKGFSKNRFCCFWIFYFYKIGDFDC
jgi:hypothetical protein